MRPKLTYMMNTYFNKEKFHRKLLSHNDAALYFSRAIATKNIVFEVIDQNIVGYLEIWRLDKEQLAKIVNYENIDSLHENLTRGEFVFIAGLYIDKAYRRKSIVQKLKRKMEDIQSNHPYLGVVMDDLKYNRRLRIMKRDSQMLYGDCFKDQGGDNE